MGRSRSGSPWSLVHHIESQVTDKCKRPAIAGLCNLKTQNLLLWWSDRVLHGLGHAELHHGLGGNLDRFAGLRVATDASLAVRFHQTAQARHDEYATLLGLFD